MKLILKILCFILSTSWVSSTIDGLSYMDPLIQRTPRPYLRGEDPCKPLYWYPRHMPDYCYTDKIIPQPMPIPLPPPPPLLPVMIPPTPPPPVMLMPSFPSLPYPIPPGMPYPPPQSIYPSAVPEFISPYAPQYLAPSPYGASPMLPEASPPIMAPEMQAGFQPGLPGMVSHDGGINILPFSDAYADMLEKHKQKIIRKKLQKLLDDYDHYPRKRRQRRYRKRLY